jgi:hypothetical protein
MKGRIDRHRRLAATPVSGRASASGVVKHGPVVHRECIVVPLANIIRTFLGVKHDVVRSAFRTIQLLPADKFSLAGISWDLRQVDDSIQLPIGHRIGWTRQSDLLILIEILLGPLMAAVLLLTRLLAMGGARDQSEKASGAPGSLGKIADLIQGISLL